MSFPVGSLLRCDELLLSVHDFSALPVVKAVFLLILPLSSAMPMAFESSCAGACTGAFDIWRVDRCHIFVGAA